MSDFCGSCLNIHVLSQRFLASLQFFEAMGIYPDSVRFLENLSHLIPKCSLIQIITHCRFSLTDMDIHELGKLRFFCFSFSFFFFQLPCYSFSYSPLLSRSLPSVITSPMQLCYQGLKGIDPTPSLFSTSDWRTKWRPKCYLELLSKGIQ